MEKIFLSKRLPTALVLLVIVFLCIQFPSRFFFFLFTQLVIFASLFEFYNLFRKTKHRLQKLLGFFLALIISLSFYFEEISTELSIFVCLIIAAVYFVLSIRKVEKIGNFPVSLAVTFFGALYLSLTLNYFNLLREEYGPFYIYFLLSLIFIGDTGAYFFGMFLGRHKLAPMASPKKTWEGSFGGIVFACGGAVAVQQILIRDVLIWKAILFALVIHIAAQISDAFESLFKRAVGVKDSSNILPGHGGFLDRIDSLILTAPLFYYLLKFFRLTS